LDRIQGQYSSLLSNYRKFATLPIESIQKRIDELDNEIKSRVASRKEDLRIAMSIPGIGFTAAVIILAESVISRISINQSNLQPGQVWLQLFISQRISMLQAA